MNPNYIAAQRKALIAIVKDCQYQMMLSIEPCYFQDQGFKAIWDGVINCVSLGKGVTEENVKDAIRQSGIKHGPVAIEVLGNLMKLDEVYPPTLPAILAEGYRQHVIDSAIEKLTDTNATFESRVEAIKGAYEGVMGGGPEGAQEIQDLIHLYFERIESGESTEMVKRSIELHNNLDRLFGNKLFPAPYAICAAPGFRKTGLLVNLIIECAINRSKRTLVYTFEDSAETFMAKIISARFALNYEAVVSGTLGEKQAELKNKIHGKTWPIHIDDRQYRYDQWAMDVRRQCMTRRIDLIVVDFIQAFTYNRNHEVAELNQITKGIRQLTKEFMVPIVFASQVNDRESDKKTGEVNLTAGAAKGSGSINEDVRWLCVIDGMVDQEEKRIKVFKNTWGPCAWKRARFDGPSGMLLEVDRWLE